MRALLMHPERDFEPTPDLPWNAQALIQDLGLDPLLGAMAAQDDFLLDVARKALLSGFRNDIATILYRQAVLRDCLSHPCVVRDLYTLSVRVIEAEKKHWWLGLGRSPGSILYSAVELLQMFVEMLRRLRDLASASSASFRSPGFTTLFNMLERELGEEYLAKVSEELTELQFHHGVLLSAELGKSGEGVRYTLRKLPPGEKQSWLDRILSKGPSGYTFRLSERDESGARFLSELKDRGVNEVANALMQSSDHIKDFFVNLRSELAFYVGCLNLRDRLQGKELPIAFPDPTPSEQLRQNARGLYDISLALTLDRGVVSNDLEADHKTLVLITGANQGGKSSFLRSIGTAQLMMQAGAFVGAEALTAALCPAVFTHYRREEDPSMKYGKLDEELARMGEIADHLKAHALVLFNESFAATHEREGSEIARQIVTALREKQIRVVFVTHLYEFARGVFEDEKDGALFLRAERKADGTRTFKLIPGKPLETSFGEDLYQKVFAS